MADLSNIFGKIVLEVPIIDRQNRRQLLEGEITHRNIRSTETCLNS